MMVAALVLAAVSAASSIDKSPRESVQALLQEEPPDVFLAKATLQQYLSRVVRKDWDGVRRLTHPKTLAALENGRIRSRELAPWDDGEPELKTFRFVGAREVAPGVVLVQVGEDTYRPEEQGMSVDEASVYVLFKSRGGFLVGDRKDGAELAEVSDHFARARYPGYVDGQVQAQARRESAMGGKHR
ncbi:MAG TPA: hypothetical protein VI356_17735 [Myxococcales bacterium]